MNYKQIRNFQLSIFETILFRHQKIMALPLLTNWILMVIQLNLHHLYFRHTSIITSQQNNTIFPDQIVSKNGFKIIRWNIRQTALPVFDVSRSFSVVLVATSTTASVLFASPSRASARVLSVRISHSNSCKQTDGDRQFVGFIDRLNDFFPG